MEEGSASSFDSGLEVGDYCNRQLSSASPNLEMHGSTQDGTECPRLRTAVGSCGNPECGVVQTEPAKSGPSSNDCQCGIKQKGASSRQTSLGDQYCIDWERPKMGVLSNGLEHCPLADSIRNHTPVARDPIAGWQLWGRPDLSQNPEIPPGTKYAIEFYGGKVPELPGQDGMPVDKPRQSD
ncbi:hypothetical protein TWF506_000871 [Arthrobotrys conoides]|uniref:Uncharacterized protein n=1 Tax=Arthrobotrys conoides TaxID=74498 RepID=A0AAN8RXY6_9PEZI